MNNILSLAKIVTTEDGKYAWSWDNFVKDPEVLNTWIDTTLGMILRIIITLIAINLIIKIGNKLINKFVDKQVKSKLSFSLDPQKAITIGEVLKSVLKYTVYLVGVALMFYDVFAKIPVALASAGGFAIGLGAQSLVKDLINGFFFFF